MKADLTRSTFRREKHYSGVRMQQGRVQLDADWNEHVDIGTYLDETTRTDVIGACGAPEGNAGFGIDEAPGGADLLLSAGRMYVDGILGELDASPISVESVETGKAALASVVADGRELVGGDWIAFSATGVGPLVTRLDAVDMGTLEVSFESGRELSAAQVSALEAAGDAVVRRVTSYLTQPHLPDPEDALEQGAGTYLAYLDIWQRHSTALEDGEIREVALGGPDTATRTQTVWQVRLERLGDADAEITCASLPAFGTFIDLSSGALRGRAQPETTQDDLCTIPPGAGYRRLENQLYRVEIHDPGTLGGDATFKWSRENGSVVVSCVKSVGDKLTVSSLGRDEVLGFAAGDWVELTDDAHELAGLPGTLVKLKPPENDVLVVDTTTATGSLDLTDFPTHPRVRRWDDPNGRRKVEVGPDNAGWLRLEDGVEIRFEPGRYKTGDYWLIPARTAGGDVEWPEDSSGRELAKPREGIVHHYCRLAILRLGEAWEVVEDCRDLFPPLTGIAPGAEEPGIHVVRVGTRAQKILRNDSDLPVRELAAGIEVLCDGDVEPSTAAGKPTCLVTLDLPFPVGPSDQGVWGDRLVGTTPLTLDAIVGVAGPQIRWQPSGLARKWLLGRLVAVMRELKLRRLLVHLTLKGNFIYGAGEPELNLDGEAFGVVREGVLDVVLPSGDTRRGGDLEMWFWLTAGRTPETIGVVIASYTKSAVLTTKARRAGVPQALALVAEREVVQASLPPGYEVDVAVAIDPEKARAIIVKLRLGTGTGATRLAAAVRLAPEGGRGLRTAVEEPLMPLAERLVELLAEHEVPVPLELVPVADFVSSIEELIRSEGGLDLVVAGQNSIDLLDATRPEIFPVETRVVL